MGSSSANAEQRRALEEAMRVADVASRFEVEFTSRLKTPAVAATSQLLRAGHVGRRVARRLRARGVPVIATDDVP